MAEYEPLTVEHAEGCWLTTTDGRRLFDGVSSLWCNVHGHAHPTINAAIAEQLSRVSHVTSLGASNPTTIELARRLAAIAPEGLEHVFFSGDGSSAVEVAIKQSLQYWRQRKDPRPAKTKYVALDNAYHGDTLGSVSVGGVARFHAMFQPLLFETIRAKAPSTYPLPEGESVESVCAESLRQFEELLATRSEEIAAVVMEPLVQAAAGMVTHPPGYLRGIRDLTRKYDVHLIADEVAVGFGRTGRMFACEHEDVAPDFLCLGKGLTGGYLAMAATLTTTEVWTAFLGDYTESKSFFHGHTFSGNPLAAAAGLASLQVFDDERTLETMPAKVEHLKQLLEPLLEHPHVGDIRQRGLLVGIELVRDKSSHEPFPWEEQRGIRVCQHALSEGVWLRPLGSVIVVMPPLAIDENALERIVHSIRNGIDVATSH